MFARAFRRGAFHSLFRYSAPSQLCSRPWRNDFVGTGRDSFRGYCEKVEFSEMTEHRKNLLKVLFLECGASDLDTEIKCETLEESILRLVNGLDDPVTREIAHKIVTTADLDHNGTINWPEFVKWFEPIPDHNLNLAQLFNYWSMNSELKSPRVIFNSVWSALRSERGEENLTFPSEILVCP